jgi:hypothetical protein
MQLRKLGQSDLAITPIGIGAWAIGGGQWEFGWGPQNDEQSIAAVHAGLDLSVPAALNRQREFPAPPPSNSLRLTWPEAA